MLPDEVIKRRNGNSGGEPLGFRSRRQFLLILQRSHRSELYANLHMTVGNFRVEEG